MKNCSSCQNAGNCSSCGGCGNCLYLTQQELSLLQLFAQLPFLPVARRADSAQPVFLEECDCPRELIPAALEALEQKGLIDLDYHSRLKGFDYSAYAPLPLLGSMALTARGQNVLDTLNIQGIE